MFDSSSRNIHYVRLSVTDLCNLRCRYCMPDGVEKLEREAVLTYEEFLRLAALLEVKQYRQQHHDGREQREDQQTRNDRQQRGGRLEDGIGQIDLRRHIHAGSTQRALHAVTLVLVHSDKLGELDGPAKEDRVQ